jgi:hypothetical protein
MGLLLRRAMMLLMNGENAFIMRFLARLFLLRLLMFENWLREETNIDRGARYD